MMEPGLDELAARVERWLTWAQDPKTETWMLVTMLPRVGPVAATAIRLALLERRWG